MERAGPGRAGSRSRPTADGHRHRAPVRPIGRPKARDGSVPPHDPLENITCAGVGVKPRERVGRGRTGRSQRLFPRGLLPLGCRRGPGCGRPDDGQRNRHDRSRAIWVRSVGPARAGLDPRPGRRVAAMASFCFGAIEPCEIRTYDDRRGRCLTCQVLRSRLSAHSGNSADHARSPQDDRPVSAEDLVEQRHPSTVRIPGSCSCSVKA